MDKKIYNLDLVRREKQALRTFGVLYIDGALFCNTLEDTDRGLNADTVAAGKVFGETAIPNIGTPYKVILDFSEHFQKILPHILDVPSFEGVKMHGGNTEADTEGCVLVGHNRDSERIWNSASVDLVNKMNSIALLPNFGGFQLTIHEQYGDASPAPQEEQPAVEETVSSPVAETISGETAPTEQPVVEETNEVNPTTNDGDTPNPA